jgi:formate dehydrogenase accessory protein FdhE
MSKAVIDAILGLIGREHVSEPFVRFRAALAKAQHVALARLEAAEGEGWPLQADVIPDDTSPLPPLLEALAVSLAEAGDKSEDVARLIEAAKTDDSLLARLARAAAFGPDQDALSAWSEDLGVSVDGLLFFGRAMAAPYVHAARRARGPLPGLAAGVPGCPACGTEAGLATLRGEAGERHLHCSLCGARWRYDRARCAACGDGAQLVKLDLGKGSSSWIDACDACKRYIKTVDTRHGDVPDDIGALVAATETLFLDLIAEEHGYERRLPFASLI